MYAAMICDKLSNARLYEKSHPLFAKALCLLSDPALLTMPDGRHEIDGSRLIAMPQRYDTKPAGEGKWEAHRRYIDIQFVREGAEAMGWAPIGRLTPSTAYDAQKDVEFFTGEGSGLLVESGMFAIFFPEDGHMPCLSPGDQRTFVRKIVLKVAVE